MDISNLSISRNLFEDLVDAFYEYDNGEYDKDGRDWCEAQVYKALAHGDEIGVMYTTCGANEEHDLQVSYDLQGCRLVGYLDDDEVISETFTDLFVLADDLRNGWWDGYYSWITDAEEVQHAIDLEDCECNVCYRFSQHINPATSADLRTRYREATGETGEFSQADAGRWCIEHNDDLGDASLREALNAYYREI